MNDNLKKLGKTEMRVFEEISGRGSGHPTHTHTYTEGGVELRRKCVLLLQYGNHTSLLHFSHKK